jgi:serine/threonine protein kinase
MAVRHVEDIEAALQRDFHSIFVLTAGSQGTIVRVGRRRSDDKRVALKCVPASPSATRESRRRETELTGQVVHANVVQSYGAYEGVSWTVQVLEFCSDTLLRVAQKRGRFTEDQARMAVRQVASALACCHAYRVAHRDVKLENVLVRADGSLALCDFGFARRYEEGECFTDSCGSLAYACPELLAEPCDARVYPEPADAWALGVLLYGLVAGRLPFGSGLDVLVTKQLIRGPPLAMSTWMSPLLAAMLREMLCPEPASRPGFMRLLADPWLGS